MLDDTRGIVRVERTLNVPRLCPYPSHRVTKRKVRLDTRLQASDKLLTASFAYIGWWQNYNELEDEALLAAVKLIFVLM